MDKVVQGRGTHICLPTSHRFIICREPAICCYPLCLMCSSPFNLCRALLSDLQPLFPFHPCDTPFFPCLSLSMQCEPPLWQDCHLWFWNHFLFAMIFPCVWLWSPSYSPACIQNQPTKSVMKLDCHLLPAGTSPLSHTHSCTTVAKTEQYCHLLCMQIQLTSLILFNISLSVFCLFFSPSLLTEPEDSETVVLCDYTICVWQQPAQDTLIKTGLILSLLSMSVSSF